LRSIINIAQIVLVVILLVNAALVWWRHLNITSKQKNREWDRKQNLSPTRTLRAEESRAIQELYQLEIPAGTEVFPISGRFRCNYVAEGELATKVSDHYWIGDFEVLYDDSWDTYLKDINLAEIVWQNKYIAQPACLLNLNGELDIVSLTRDQKKVTEKGGGDIPSAGLRIRSARAMTMEEQALFEVPPLGIMGCLGLAASLVLLFLSQGALSYMTACLIGVLLSLWLFVCCSKAKPIPLSRIVLIEGNVVATQKTDCTGSGEVTCTQGLAMGRVPLRFPDHWHPYLVPGRSYCMTAILLPTNRHFSPAQVLDTGTGLSLAEEVRKFGPEHFYGRHRCLCITMSLLLVCLIALMDRPLATVATLFGSLTRQTVVKDFESIQQLRESPPKPNDQIRVKAIYAQSFTYDAFYNYKPRLRYEEDHLIDTLPFTPPDLTPMEKRILSLVSTNGNDSRHRENPCQDIGTDPWQCNLYYATLLNALKINQDHSNAEKRLLEILAWETERWIAQWLLQRSQKMLAQGICLKGWKAHRLVGKFHLSLPDTPHLETYDIMQAFKSLKQVLREENLQRTTEISGVVAEVSANLLVLKGDLVSIGTALTRTLVFLTVIVIFVWNLRQMLLKQGKNKQRMQLITDYCQTTQQAR